MSTTIRDDSEALAHVHELYALHAECDEALQRRSWSKDFKAEMERKLRALSKALRVVRRQCLEYLGGDEVLLAIEGVQAEVRERIEVIPQ